MKKNLTIACIAVLAFTACKKDVQPLPELQERKGTEEAAWSSSDRWGTWQNGGYTVYNNVWGSGYGAQNIWANSYSNWGVWANHPNTGGIKSYPNSTRNVNRTLSSLASVSSPFNITVPSGGAWVAAYDIWDNNHQYETMLWLNYTGNANGGGNVKPISYNWDANGNAVPVFTNVSVGGHTWNVFRGSNGANQVFSFLRTSKTSSGTINILAIQNWIRNQGWFGNITLGDVQLGFEITSSFGTNGNGLNFTVNSYSVAFN
jgi:hypothetical protein